VPLESLPLPSVYNQLLATKDLEKARAILTEWLQILALPMVNSSSPINSFQQRHKHLDVSYKQASNTFIYHSKIF
jgi:hypothetical protein